MKKKTKVRILSPADKQYIWELYNWDGIEGVFGQFKDTVYEELFDRLERDLAEAKRIMREFEEVGDE